MVTAIPLQEVAIGRQLIVFYSYDWNQRTAPLLTLETCDCRIDDLCQLAQIRGQGVADLNPLLGESLFLPPGHDARAECVIVPYRHSLLHDAAVRTDALLPQRFANLRHYLPGKRPVPRPRWP